MHRLLNHYILIERLPMEDKTPSGLILPSTRKLPYLYGQIKMKDEDNVKSVTAGEKVYFFERGIAARDVKIDGNEYDLVREDALIYVE